MGQGRWHSSWLDLLRALAICLVIVRHGVFVPGLPAPESWWALPFFNVAANGWLGVDLFFVLSGFLLSSQIFRSLMRTGEFDRGAFLARRAMRTLPAYLAVMLLLWFGFLDTELGTEGVADVQVLLTHLVFVNDYFGSPLMVTLWSLATEEKFYLLMAFALPALWSLRYLKAFVITVFLVLVLGRSVAYLMAPNDNYAAFFWLYRAPFHFALDGLLLGVLAGAVGIRRGAATGPGLKSLACILFAVAVLLSIVEWAAEGSAGLALIAIPAFSLLVMGLVLAAPAADAWLPAGLLQRLWRFIAAISYSLYLVHYPVAQLAASAFDPKQSGPTFLATYWLVYLATSLFFGWLLYISVERPGLWLRDRMFAAQLARLEPVPRVP